MVFLLCGRVKLQAVYALGQIAANDPEAQAYIKEVTLLSEVDGRQKSINGLACIAGGLKVREALCIIWIGPSITQGPHALNDSITEGLRVY